MTLMGTKFCLTNGTQQQILSFSKAFRHLVVVARLSLDDRMKLNKTPSDEIRSLNTPKIMRNNIDFGDISPDYCRFKRHYSRKH